VIKGDNKGGIESGKKNIVGPIAYAIIMTAGISKIPKSSGGITSGLFSEPLLI
jgi:hypothetical protein